jgi:phenylalanyl-tRNA synthetase beta chain
MRAPLSWLRDFAPFDQPVAAMADALSGLGLVVDGVEVVGEDLPHVVVAKILDVRAHPAADRIRLVDVDAGDGQPLQIACGASNMGPGDLVPLAQVGAVLPNGTAIGRRKMRGEWSNGMLCSPSEIGVPEPEGHDGLLILPPGLAAPGTPISEALGGVDVVFDLDVSPNRPDALSMAGVARDLAAALGVPFAWPKGWPDGARPVGGPDLALRAGGPGTDLALPAGGPGPRADSGGVPIHVVEDPSVGRALIEVEDPDLCARFTGTVLAGVRVGPSPAWLANRLILAGMRPINNVVDVSNYVMLDTGQPNHAYDLDRLAGGGLIVRRAHEGETLVTLDGAERRFGPEDLLICDGASQPVGVAGIMGGASSEISDETTSVLLEAAWFSPMAVARTGTRLGLTSEARHRFERGVDTELAPRAVARFADLLAASSLDGASGAGLRLGPTVDVISDADLPAPAVVTLRTARVNGMLGVNLDAAAIVGLLAPIGFEVVPAGAGAQTVTVPTWRPDTEREIDVIEEIARHYGYPNIRRSLPAGARTGGLTPYQRDRRLIRDVLVGAGLLEAWTTTFLAPGDLERAGLPAEAVAVENPLDRSESLLRTALLPGLLKAARFNADRQQPDVRLFETGRVFQPPREGSPTPEEIEMVAVLLAGAQADAKAATRIWSLLRDAVRAEGTRLVAADVSGLHPTRAARIVGSDGVALGAVGEVDPDVVASYGLSGRVGYLSLDLAGLIAEPRRPRISLPISRYPASDVDLAFAVPESVPAADVVASLRRAGGDLLEDVALFDVFRGPQVGADRRSLAFRLRLRAQDHTLTDDELAAARRAAIDATVSEHAAELRA